MALIRYQFVLSYLVLTAASGACFASEQEWKDWAVKAYVYEASGKNAEAQKAYEKAFNKAKGVKKSEDVQHFQKRYKAFNRKWLLSQQDNLETHLHTVEEGETLGKIAEKYKTTAGFLKQINRLSKSSIYPGMKLKVIAKPLSIEVDKSKNILSVIQGRKHVRNYPVATGRHHKTPAKQYVIVSKLENPTWYKAAGKVIPPNSPENGLGTRWLGFDHSSFGIHGTIEPEKIGTYASAGCVRMLNHDVEELYTMIPIGTKVNIKE